ncbi:MAG: ABC transporter ATP-binding protein [Undibacterium sp.]|nr:ABC transporter ATP-binding protein [Undibacterium sp.]
MSEAVLLSVQDLHAFYGKSHVLQGVNFHLEKGEILALLGRNGAGRSTTLKAIVGQARAQGCVQFKGEAILGLASFEIARKGIAYVPEGRDVFAGLSVEQNLELGRKTNSSFDTNWQLEEMYTLFPHLLARRNTKAGVLSGGEQQMLSLARSLMGNPELFLVDEPTEGLAPQAVAAIAVFLKQLKARGVAVLLVEQKLQLSLTVADRVLVMGQGRVVFEGYCAELKNNLQVRQTYLEV